MRWSRTRRRVQYSHRTRSAPNVPSCPVNPAMLMCLVRCQVTVGGKSTRAIVTLVLDVLSIGLLPPDVTGVHGGRTHVHVNAFGHVELDERPPRTGKLVRNVVPWGRVQRGIWEHSPQAGQDLGHVEQVRHHGLPHWLALGSRRRERSEGAAWQSRRGRYRSRAACTTSEVEVTLSCYRSSASVGPSPPSPGLVFARARSNRNLGAMSKRSSHCVVADHHPSAEMSGRGRSVLRNTRLERAAMTVRAALARRTISGILHRCLSWSVPRCLQLSTNRRGPLSTYRSWAWSSCHSRAWLASIMLFHPKGNDTLPLTFLGVKAEPMPCRNFLQSDHDGAFSWTASLGSRAMVKMAWSSTHVGPSRSNSTFWFGPPSALVYSSGFLVQIRQRSGTCAAP